MNFFPADKPPYPQQRRMVEVMQEAIANNENALVEGPTGVGKTLCILAVAAAARQKVFVCSRTHAQLKQMLAVFKSLACDRRSVVLGSRDQACCNSELAALKGTAKNDRCTDLIRTKACSFAERFLGFNGVEDIEDMVARGLQQNACAYLSQRKLAADADIVFCPYNYLLDPRLRMETAGAVVIIDEAHSIEAVLRDALGFRCERAKLRRAVDYFKSNRAPDLAALFDALLKTQTAAPVLEKLPAAKHATGFFNELAEQAVFVLTHARAAPDAFVFHVDKDVLNIECLAPELAMRGLDARSLILVSGTLAPFDALAAELGVAFKHRVATEPVIDMRRQALVRIVKSWDSVPLDASFKNANKAAYYTAVGRALVDIAARTPNGMLVFFKSYDALEVMRKSWAQSGLWAELQKQKTVCLESSDADRAAYAEKTKDGALMLAVYRGKLSEGMDFADGLARAVVCVGIPFAPIAAPAVGGKRKYNDMHRPLLKGQRWYMREALRAVRQALGRGLRHANDFCAFVLLDAAFAEHTDLLSEHFLAVTRAVDSSILNTELETFFSHT